MQIWQAFDYPLCCISITIKKNINSKLLLFAIVDLQGVDVHHVDVRHLEEEWGDATVVTYDQEEWRALWKSNTYRPATNDVNEDEDEVDIDDI